MSRLFIGAVAGLVACAHAPEQALSSPPGAEPAALRTHVSEKKPREATAAEKAWLDVLKNAVGPEWTSRIETAVEANDPEGCKDFVVERSVVVEYVVNAEGVLTSARVKESSGVPYIDKIGPEAFTAVHRVTPPPRSLAGKHLSFAFHVNARPNPYSCAK